LLKSDQPHLGLVIAFKDFPITVNINKFKNSRSKNIPSIFPLFAGFGPFDVKWKIGSDT